MSGSPSGVVVTTDSDGLPSHELMVSRLLGSKELLGNFAFARRHTRWWFLLEQYSGIVC